MHGIPENEQPRLFRPDGSYPADDLSWYANIPVPTSYMCSASAADFFGGYDHKAHAGIVHVADHHIAPGKKQWCWGNHEFGYAWDRLLTIADGTGVHRPYIELMAGVYTDNQPDFSFLTPGETRAFTQYWYPIRDIGPAHQANADAALSIQMRRADDGGATTARIGVVATSKIRGARVVLKDTGDDGLADVKLASWRVDLAPDQPFTAELPLAAGIGRQRLALRVLRADDSELIAYQPPPGEAQSAPPSASEPPSPEAIASNDELFVTGLHLEQYRHATRSPDGYWREALRRDPHDARCNNALGLWLMRRGEFAAAQRHLRAALQRLTLRNPNPADGEAHYNLGVCLRYQEDRDAAYDAFYKASWNGAWRAAACLALAEIDAARGDYALALEHVEQGLRSDADNLHARKLKTIALRHLHQAPAAAACLAETLALDPLDAGARWLAGKALACDTQTRIDIAIALARCGQVDDAIALLDEARGEAGAGSRPLLDYYLAAYAQQAGDAAGARAYRASAARESRDYCFPSRLEDLVVLEEALRHTPGDAAAHYYLGNLLYDKRRHREAIAHWEKSAARDPSFPTVWRNLGIGRYNVLHDAQAARDAYATACALDPSDARLLYERDQLWKRTGVAPRERLAELERHTELAASRDDLCVELCALYNHVGRAYQACGTRQSAREVWQKSAAFRGDFQSMSVRAYSELSAFSARALAELGHGDAAATMFRAIADHAEDLLETKATIDYFATSLPTMLLFDDDPQKRQSALAHLMLAQAHHGLNDDQRAHDHLARVLDLDPNNAQAIDLARELAPREVAMIIAATNDEGELRGAGQEQYARGGSTRG